MKSGGDSRKLEEIAGGGHLDEIVDSLLQVEE